MIMQTAEYPFIKIFSMTRPKSNGMDQYYRELTTLGDKLYEILDQGKRWANEVSVTLKNGGGAIFPHTFFSQCGEQIGAVIHAILDSGIDQIILLGTLHPFPHLLSARIKEFNGEEIFQEPSWGIIDPESGNGKGLIRDEFSLNLFKSLLKIEVERRGIKAPRLIERYPSLANRHPEALPGMKELKELAKSAAIVGTEDYCHHGVAYAIPKNSALPIGDQALSFARNQIEEGFSLLEKNKYGEFYNHGLQLNALGDPTDVTTTMHYLVGAHAKPKILDLKLVDVSHLFEGDPSPSWVAATLAKITRD
jgi:hypothetical protein